MVIVETMMSEAQSHSVFFCRLRRKKTNRDSDTKAVARQTGVCVSEQGASWAEGVRRLVNTLRAQQQRALAKNMFTYTSQRFTLMRRDFDACLMNAYGLSVFTNT